MARTRWAAHVLAAALLAVHWAGRQPATPPAPESTGPLEGTWVIESVERDGQSDPAQVGAAMTFADGSLTFLPKVVQFSDALD
jgi:hypothetical protein